MRAIAILTGFVLLGMATWAVIVDAGLKGPHAGLVAAMAAGTAAGAFVIARSSMRVAMLALIAVALGESFGMLMTAERVILQRETAAIEAAKRSPEARRALDNLTEARKALERHDAIAVTTVSKADCGKACSAKLADTRASLMRDRVKAEADMAGIPGAKPSLLAGYLGLAPWALDLIAAGLLSIGANGLACVLIAWGAHDAPKPIKSQPEAPSTLPVVAPPQHPGGLAEGVGGQVVQMRRKASARDASRFLAGAIKPSSGGETPLRPIAEAYWTWCDSQGVERPSLADTFGQLTGQFTKVGVEMDLAAGREVVVRGVALTG